MAENGITRRRAILAGLTLFGLTCIKVAEDESSRIESTYRKLKGLLQPENPLGSEQFIYEKAVSGGQINSYPAFQAYRTDVAGPQEEQGERRETETKTAESNSKIEIINPPAPPPEVQPPTQTKQQISTKKAVDKRQNNERAISAAIDKKTDALSKELPSCIKAASQNNLMNIIASSSKIISRVAPQKFADRNHMPSQENIFAVLVLESRQMWAGGESAPKIPSQRKNRGIFQIFDDTFVDYFYGCGETLAACASEYDFVKGKAIAKLWKQLDNYYRANAKSRLPLIDKIPSFLRREVLSYRSDERVPTFMVYLNLYDLSKQLEETCKDDPLYADVGDGKFYLLHMLGIGHTKKALNKDNSHINVNSVLTKPVVDQNNLAAGTTRHSILVTSGTYSWLSQEVRPELAKAGTRSNFYSMIERSFNRYVKNLVVG